MNLRPLVLSTALALSGFAYAAGPVYVVTTTADVPDAVIDGVCETAVGNHTCTLRAAMMEANHGPNPDGLDVVINLPAGVYLLTRAVGATDDETNGDLNLEFGYPVHIQGAGEDASIIDANHVDRAITIELGALTLADLRIQGGRPSTTGMRNAQGGGIYSHYSSLTLLRCLVRDNKTPSTEGGCIKSTWGSLDLVDSMVRVCDAGASFGGGISAQSSDTTITRSAIYANTADYAAGLQQIGGTLKVANSSVSQNLAAIRGGGIEVFSASAELNNVTVAGNQAGGATLPAGAGMQLAGATVVLSNSIFANSSTSGPNDDFTCDTSTATSNGYNMIRAASGCVTGAYLNADPFAAPLGAYGGPTATQPLPKLSAAVNAGDPAGCLDSLATPLATDQRGVKRKIGAACDLGAFEVEPIGDANGDGTVSVTDVFWLVNFLFAGGPAPLGRANVNGGNGAIDVSDVFYLINYLFAGGAAPV